MAKTLSLKVDEDDFGEAENDLGEGVGIGLKCAGDDDGIDCFDFRSFTEVSSLSTMAGSSKQCSIYSNNMVTIK